MLDVLCVLVVLAIVYALVKFRVCLSILFRDRLLKHYGVGTFSLPQHLVASEVRFCYPKSNRVYGIRFPLLKECYISAVHSHKGNITKAFLQYLGPGHNFYGIPTSPYLLGYSSLEVVYTNGVKATYTNHDVISVALPYLDSLD